MTIFWTIRGEKIENTELSNNRPIFNVHPISANLKPMETFRFEVTFRPSKDSYYFFQMLQYVVIKYNTKSTDQVAEEMRKLELIFRNLH